MDWKFFGIHDLLSSVETCAWHVLVKVFKIRLKTGFNSAQQYNVLDLHFFEPTSLQVLYRLSVVFSIVVLQFV